jgi:sec-independent protein translocase protein TatA
MFLTAYSMGLRVAMIPGGVGYLELLVLFALILVFFGPDKLPGIARKMGHMMEQLRRAANHFQQNLLALEDEVKADADDTSFLDEPDMPPYEDGGADLEDPDYPGDDVATDQDFLPGQADEPPSDDAKKDLAHADEEADDGSPR